MSRDKTGGYDRQKERNDQAQRVKQTQTPPSSADKHPGTHTGKELNRGEPAEAGREEEERE